MVSLSTNRTLSLICLAVCLTVLAWRMPRAVAQMNVTPVQACGAVTAFTAATGSAAGLLALGGQTYPIAPGTTLIGQSAIAVGKNICLSGKLNASGQLVEPSSVTVNPGTTVSVCGPITAYVAATDTTAGTITIGGVTFVVTPGVPLNGAAIGTNFCLNATVNPAGQVILPSVLTLNSNNTAATCGTVTAFTAATAGAAGSLTLGGVVFPIAPGATLGGANLLSAGASLCLAPVFNASNQLTSASVLSTPTPGEVAGCPQITVNGVVRGTSSSPAGLSQPFYLTTVSRLESSGFVTFNVNPSTFGSTPEEIGAPPGNSAEGFAFSLPGSTYTAVSCLDSVWDVGFSVAGLGEVEGDEVTIFRQNPDGTNQTVIATLRGESNGLRVTRLNPWVGFHRSSGGVVSEILRENSFIPVTNYAGAAGSRSDRLFIPFPMDLAAPFNDCAQIGVTIRRGNGQGTTSVVVTDALLMRNQPGNARPCATLCTSCTLPGLATSRALAASPSPLLRGVR